MINLLTKISNLDSLQDIIFLSSHGEILFGNLSASQQEPGQQIVIWKQLLSLLGQPQSAEFHFDGGLHYVCGNHLGYLLVTLKGEADLHEVKAVCMELQSRLANSPSRKKALLQMLEGAEDVYKPQIVKELIAVADKEVAVRLLSQLQKINETDEAVREQLTIQLSQTLGHCALFEAVKPLKKFADILRRAGRLSSEVERAINVSIQQLEFDKESSSNAFSSSKLVEKETFGSEITDEPEIPSPPTKIKPPRQSANSAEEERIKKLIAAGKKKEAVLALLKIIEIAAKQRKFEVAEKLRGKLLEIDSMALKEIIRAAEIIEEQKVAAIDPEHLDIWKILVGMLSQEEFSTLYHLMTNKRYRSGEMMVKQGAFLSQLFFINSGQMQLFTKVDNKEIPLKSLGPGEIIGSGSFFEASVWTVSARSLGVEVFELSREKLEMIQDQYPSIESKLLDFSALFASSNKAFQRTKKSRRRQERKKISGRAAVALLDAQGKETGVGFKGELSDISRGGLSFCINVSRKKNALLLFGVRLRVEVQSSRGVHKSQHQYRGRIVAVRGHHAVSNEYSIHVEFDKVIDHQELLIVANPA